MIVQFEDNKRENFSEEIHVDLVVVGGGLSGLCSAIAAARQGIKVALVQDRPVLGGNASSEVRVWALGATSHAGNNNRWAREGGIIDEILVENTFRNKEGNPILFDALLLEKVMGEPNITLLLNTSVFDVTKSDSRNIDSVIAFNSQNSTRYIIKGKLFCDASGDGIVGYLSGASFRVGAEKQSEFKESFTPTKEYGAMLGHTIFFYTKMTDKPVMFVPLAFALQDITQIPRFEDIHSSNSGCNYWWFEYGGIKDTITNTEEIKAELWKVVYGAWHYIKNSGKFPEAENMTLEWVGTIPGKRESRRFEGLYMLTQNEIVSQTHFEDAVVFGGWAIDLHPADGVYSPLPGCNQYHSKGVYEIPYRCYVSKDIENLYVAGRLISVSHVAFGSTRVMLTAGAGGQVIGTAAALCVKNSCMPAQLLQSEKMKELQSKLNLDGQSIPFTRISESENLAAKAILSASSTLKLNQIPFNGDWRNVEFSVAQLLPLKKDVAYSFEINVKASKATQLVCELVVSQKQHNYTPDTLIESKTIDLTAGEQTVEVKFTKGCPEDQYAFFIVRRNQNVDIQTSKMLFTGSVSVCNMFNIKVNNLGKQTPPENIGFEAFEFFTPERRPKGHNIAMNIKPAIEDFEVSNIVNGLVRPHLSTNAWVASIDAAEASISVEWNLNQKIKEIRLFFDTDYDHPMETVQWNHPENEMPFCVKQYSIEDELGNVLVNITDNHQTINKHIFEKGILAKGLKIKFEKTSKYIPISLFELEIR